MKFFKRKDDPQGDTAKPEQIARIVRMDKPSLHNWMNTTIMGLGESFDRWRFHGEPKEEVTQHLNVLNAIWQELDNRNS